MLFEDGSGRVEFFVDILEHKSTEIRPNIVAEIFKVVSLDGEVYPVVPFGKTVEVAD